MFEAFIATALLTLMDPPGDAVGNGSLQAPSAAIYRNLAPFDLRTLTVTDDPQLSLRIEMGSLSDPFELPLGFSLPVIEVYLSGEEDGRNELLSGSGMRLPAGQGWEVALRLTGEQATAYRVSSGPGGIETAPAEVSLSGNELIVTTPFPRPDNPRVYAMTGLYDLFGSTPWRSLESEESPWAFSSQTQQLPVLDVLSRGEAAQIQALETGVLPPARSRQPIPGAVWLVLMAIGLLIALAGVAMRVLARRMPPAAAAGNESERPPPVSGAEGPVSWYSGSTAAAEETAGRDDTQRRFTWDSSALLTDPGEEELDEEFENEFGAAGYEPGRSELADAWQRPVPLPFVAGNRDEPLIPDDEQDPEVVQDEEEAAQGAEVGGGDGDESREAGGEIEAADTGETTDEPDTAVEPKSGDGIDEVEEGDTLDEQGTDDTLGEPESGDTSDEPEVGASDEDERR